ncbi:transcriptional regulator GcvA [Paracandidimonas soli]|jgi:LysR family glycine cleavage system transcriptional activator|uniref:LysR family glycine cleavage system transcriptional activator n=1 Tax=Paracandidimonas soli TaxID=1917182 RepID=A0A4R3UWR3_9BURK|nr:transcriptional regulator GcvA [Paracandidimonas soli]TCU95223.1 LysR family glycine cleavage system transcriptional activator [Paracandidimonas soli]
MKSIRLPSTATLMAFESAARHLNFRRAGQELHVTQGAVSQQVRLLEDQLGVALFARVRQRVVLTSAGERYLVEVRRILRDLGEVTNQAMASGDKEILNLASVPTFAVKWLVPKLETFFHEYPNVNLNLVSRNAPFDFAAEPFDAAIHYGEASWSGAVCAHLMDEDMLPVCSAQYRTQLGLHEPSDLVRAVLLQQFTRPSAWRDWFEHMGIAHANAFQGPRFDSFLMILEAVQSHLGAALLPRFLLREGLAQGSLVQLSSRVLPSSRGYYLVCPEAKQYAYAVSAFRGWLLARIM